MNAASEAEIQINCRVTSIEEALVSKRPAYSDFQVQTLETDDGPLYRLLSPDGTTTLSPLFFSKNCLDHYLTRMPLLSHDEWENHPLKEANAEAVNEALNFIPKVVVQPAPEEKSND